MSPGAIRDERVAVALGLVLPARARPRVVGRRLAVHLELDVAVHAPDRAEQDVFGLVIARRPLVLDRPLRVVVPGADEERVPDHQPSGPGLPRRLQDERPGDVAPAGGDGDVGRAEPEVAGRAVEHRPEHRGAVRPREAEPLHAPARRDERLDLPVRQERVLGDRRERAPLREPHRAFGDGHPAIVARAARPAGRGTRGSILDGRSL